ncbi:MerR family transcriptional regulator [Actinoplanes sp. OR16]|nr:MerR family transcriptional regulator [Actinoplanes sp. OR16]
MRVYHERGLLPEPPRDASGYRRYDAEHAVQLVKIRTLVQAGVPLARIGELLTAGPEQFAAATAEIDRSLRRKTEELQRTRRRIAELGRGGDQLFVSADVARYLGELRAAGISDRTIRLERDLWILLQSAAPVQARAWAADKLAAIADPEFRALYRDYDAAYDWSPDDPRLPALASRTRAWFTTHVRDDAAPSDPTAARLAAATAEASSPAWNAIAVLAAQQ